MVTPMTEMPICTQIGGDNSPSNMWAVNVGADLKPTDTTTLKFDVYYVGMVEDRTVAGEKEDEIGIEIDASLTQKIYDNLSMTVIGAYLMAEDGYGVYDGDPVLGAQASAVVTMPSRLVSASTTNSKEA